MREVHLTKELASHHGEQLLNDFKALRKIRGEVYHTFCEEEGLKYQFVTTAKKLHLEIGRMPLEVQRKFCRFLREMFFKQTDRQLLLSFKKDDERDGESGAILVTQSNGGDGCEQVYHLSPA
jgi:hypothetical protein